MFVKFDFLSKINEIKCEAHRNCVQYLNLKNEMDNPALCGFDCPIKVEDCIEKSVLSRILDEFLHLRNQDKMKHEKSKTKLLKTAQRMKQFIHKADQMVQSLIQKLKHFFQTIHQQYRKINRQFLSLNKNVLPIEKNPLEDLLQKYQKIELKDDQFKQFVKEIKVFLHYEVEFKEWTIQGYSPQYKINENYGAGGEKEQCQANNQNNIDQFFGQLKHFRLQGHQSQVNCLAYSPDGKYLASGSKDRTIRIWDSAQGFVVQEISGHQYYVNSVIFSPDGKYLASGSDDTTIILWDASNGELIHQFRGHTHPVCSTAFSPNGELLVSGSEDCTVRLWSIRKKMEEKTILQGHSSQVYSVAFSPNGSSLASGGSGNMIFIWNAASGSQIQQLNTLSGRIYAIAFAPMGRRLAAATEEKIVRIWDVEKGIQTSQLLGHTHSIFDISFSHDGNFLASVSYDKTIRIWKMQLKNGKEVSRINTQSKFQQTIAWQPNGQQIAASGLNSEILLFKLEIS